jgi:hypothetical protein
MNNYEINLTQKYPDRNGRIYDEHIRRRMLILYMNNLRLDENKKLNIEIEEYEE